EAARVPAGGLPGPARRSAVLPIRIRPRGRGGVEAGVQGGAVQGGFRLQGLLDLLPLVIAGDRLEEVRLGDGTRHGDLGLRKPPVRDCAGPKRALAVKVQVVRPGAARAGDRDVLVAVPAAAPAAAGPA